MQQGLNLESVLKELTINVNLKPFLMEVKKYIKIQQAGKRGPIILKTSLKETLKISSKFLIINY